MMKIAATLLAAIVLLSAITANASLIGSVNGQTVYDTDRNITWQSNANLATSNTFGLALSVDLGSNAGVNNGGLSEIYGTGVMTWGGALKWIAAMNAANYLGYHDWRLPTITDTGTSGCNPAYVGTDCGYNVNTTTSEMAHLYYDELGNNGYYNIHGGLQPTYGLINTSPFTNIQSASYWSGTDYAPNTGSAWVFKFNNGQQLSQLKSERFYAMAVRSGQIAAVPLPTGAWLLGSGLLGLIGVARRKIISL